MAKKQLLYLDTSVIGGLEDSEFAEDSKRLWSQFNDGLMVAVISAHTLRELQGAPGRVRVHLETLKKENVILLDDAPEAEALAKAYLKRGIIGPGSRSDAVHVALATVGRVDSLVSWNFKHIVNLGKIRLFNSVNLELGYGAIEIRSPKEVLNYEEEI